MYSFHAQYWHEISGLGKVAEIGPDHLPHGMYDPRQLRGHDVEIDGVVYRVKAVETFAIPRSPSHPYRDWFGLVI